MPCMNICNNYKIPRRAPHQLRYLEGQKFCSTCAVYMKFGGNRCPCCGFSLRHKRRHHHRQDQLQTTDPSKMTCKGICIRHRALKPKGTGRYMKGQKRCQACEVFISWPSLWCPCCGYRLRTRPRNVKYKSKLIATRKTSESFLIQGNQFSPLTQ